MTPPPCNCAHVEQIVVWVRGHNRPEKQRHDRCTPPSGPHPMNEWCSWFAAKTQGVAP